MKYYKHYFSLKGILHIHEMRGKDLNEAKENFDKSWLLDTQYITIVIIDDNNKIIDYGCGLDL